MSISITDEDIVHLTNILQGKKKLRFPSRNRMQRRQNMELTWAVSILIALYLALKPRGYALVVECVAAWQLHDQDERG